MASRVPTEQLRMLLLIFWGVIVAESIRNPSDHIIPAILVLALVGFLFDLALILSKDR
jgi:hypothetical protein